MSNLNDDFGCNIKVAVRVRPLIKSELTRGYLSSKISVNKEPCSIKYSSNIYVEYLSVVIVFYLIVRTMLQPSTTTLKTTNMIEYSIKAANKLTFLKTFKLIV